MKFLICLFLALPTYAAKTSYPPQKLGAKGIKEIRISGVSGRLVINGKPGKHYTLKVKHSKGKKSEDWGLSMDRQGDALVLEVYNTAAGAQWKKSVDQDAWPEFDVEISGPSQPIAVSWREGDLFLSRWEKNFEATFLKGKFSAREIKGDIKMQLGNAQVHITDMGGKLDLKGDSGEYSFDRLKGESAIALVKGKLAFARSLGRTKIEAGDAEMTFTGIDGEWDIHQEKGRALMENAKGKIKVSAGDANWMARFIPVIDLNWVADKGSFSGQLRSGGHKLFLTSNSGEIKVPKGMSVESREGRKVVESKKDGPPMNEIFVRSDSGTIEWR